MPAKELSLQPHTYHYGADYIIDYTSTTTAPATTTSTVAATASITPLHTDCTIDWLSFMLFIGVCQPCGASRGVCKQAAKAVTFSAQNRQK
jgi:hypothetical protein